MTLQQHCRERLHRVGPAVCALVVVSALSLERALPTFGLDLSKGVAGANHLRAQRYAVGANVEVAIIDTVFYGILPQNHLDNRLMGQFDFRGKTPQQSPDPLINPMDDHETLVAHVIASSDAMYRGVAPSATIVLAAIEDEPFDTHRAASSWLADNRGSRIFNLSAAFSTNSNGSSSETLYWDWFMHSRDALLISAAANTGGPLRVPADSFNGIAVGAMNDAVQNRWFLSAYQLSGGAEGTEVRGKPDILAPGVAIWDGLTFANHSPSGTSFASPHVAGTAALLLDYASQHPTIDAPNRRGLKALILNSARKRHVARPENAFPMSFDNASPDAFYDQDYLSCSTLCTIANPLTAGTTMAWTPSGWTFDGAKLTVTKPLDDEQGVGFLDANRALINLAEGNSGPGAVRGIGWDQSTIAPSDAASSHIYAIQQTLAAGSFLTATLTWDRIVTESDGDGVVELGDTYSFLELANLDLRLLGAGNQVIAESVSTTDSVEHLHFPLPANGNPGDYKLQVLYNGSGVLATDFALAWWTDPTPLIPGDYNLDGSVTLSDYLTWRASIGSSTSTSPLIYGDGNGDGSVNAADYIIWRRYLGQSWSGGASDFQATVPEGGALFPVCSGLLLMILLHVQRQRLSFMESFD